MNPGKAAEILLLLFLCSGTGWLCYPFFTSRCPGREDLSDGWHLFLSGFAVLSLLLFFALLAHVFYVPVLILALALVSLIVNRSRKLAIRPRPGWMLSALACTTLLCAFVSPPYEAALLGEDASVYIATAFNLAKTGQLQGRDSVVTELSQTERKEFFRNRLGEDRTGPWFRFPGGVRLLDLDSGKVTFSFYHLFPAWLALGILIDHSNFLCVLSLFLAIVLMSVFRIVRPAAGLPAAILTVLTFYFFLPQQYFGRLPLSEILAQAYFLSGLSVLARSLASRSLPDKGEQRLAGLLWGCLLLTRMDAMVLLSISLLLLFSIILFYQASFREWLPMLRILVVFGILAVFHQAQSGEYLYLLTSGTFSKSGVLTYVLIGTVSNLNSFVQSHGAAAFAMVVLLCACVLFAPIPQKVAAIWSFVFRCIAFATATGLILLWTGTDLRIENFSRFVARFFPFLPLWILLLQSGCAIYAIFAGKKEQPLFLLCATVVAVTSLCYFFRPMSFGPPPQNLRRFIPMLVPLWFILSISGAFALSRRIPVHQRSAQIGASLSGLALLIYFIVQSSFLFETLLYADTLSQAQKVSERISPNGLILVPDSLAGLHLQLPLQYAFGRNSLVLPLGESPLRSSELLISYLRRQFVERREVMVLASGQDQISDLFQSFALARTATIPVSFAIIETVQKSQRPRKTETVSWPISVYRVATQRKLMDRIRYDDPQAGFLGFHEIENGFRWTTGSSTITNFSYPVSSELFITLTAGPETSSAGSIRMLLNHRFEARLSSVEGNRLVFTSKPEELKELHSITIQSPARIANPPSDLRHIGIRFVELGLSEFPDQH